MSAASKATSTAVQMGRAERLKKDLVEFATKGGLKEEYERQRKIFFEATHLEDELETESVLDWFLFDWLDDNGDGVISHYVEQQPGLREADRRILLDWRDSINSVFEVRSVARDGLQLRELDSSDVYTVKTRSNRASFKRGEFLVARLLPLSYELIFSGVQFLMPERESALAWLEMRCACDAFDSPEAVEHARREQVAAFFELFGSD